MILIFVIYYFIAFAFVSTADIDGINRRRALEKSLLSNLQARYALPPFTRALDLRAKPDEETKDHAKDSSSASKITIQDLFFEVQECILVFLNPKELLETRLVSPHFYNLSNHANYMNLKSYNPDFVLKENWMNFAMSSFLFKHFEHGRVNADDLLIAEQEILFNVTPADLQTKYSITLNLLSFIHEYENGVNSILPMSPYDFFVEIINKRADHEVPKSMEIIDASMNQYLASMRRLNEEQRQQLKDFINDTIRIIVSKPDSTAIMAHFKFNPDIPLEHSKFKRLPAVLQTASLNLIIPLFTRAVHFEEALEILSSCFIFSQALFDQFNDKFPLAIDDIYRRIDVMSPAFYKCINRKYPKDDVIGLSYLLSRNSANPFNLQELIAMGPNFSRLIEQFLPNNTVTLTEIDALNQMMEAGLLADIKDEELLRKIYSSGSGIIRAYALEVFICIKSFKENGMF